MSCFCVKNVVADMRMTMTAMTALVAAVPAPRNVSDSGAPKIVALAHDSACAGVNTPGGLSGFRATPLRTWKSAKKIGDCASRGRQLDNGLVPVSL